MVAHQRFLCRLPFVVGGVQSKRPHSASRAAAGSPRSSDPGLREKVWIAMFRVSYRVARAEQLRAGVSRQWLSVGQRARLTHLAEPQLFSHHISYNAELAPREHKQFSGRLDSRRRPGFDAGRGHVQQNGFDLSGMDLWSAGTLYKNISFVLLPSSDQNASWHFESAFVRFDNIKGSSWFNVKFGKFELDNLISEKRFLFLSGNGGLYQSYHYDVPGTINDFGYGDNQLGIEIAGHSRNSYTRYSVSVLSSNDGNPGFVSGFGTPANRGYDVNLAFSQAFNAGSLGLQRIGAFAYIGERPTYYETSTTPDGSGGTTTLQLVGLGNKPFYRAGVAGDLFLKKLELMPLFMYGHDNPYFGRRSFRRNLHCLREQRRPHGLGGLLEGHYYVSPQNVFFARFERIDVSQQPFVNAGFPTDYGNIRAYSFGYRWYPIMFSRAGLALAQRILHR